MNPLPRLSVVICNYNFARLVGAAIRGALEQDYPADLIEVIVVDDGSTDDSRAVYDQFAGDARFTALYQENRGQAATNLASVQRASGDYVCLLDSDDLYLPHRSAPRPLALPGTAIGARSGASNCGFQGIWCSCVPAPRRTAASSNAICSCAGRARW